MPEIGWDVSDSISFINNGDFFVPKRKKPINNVISLLSGVEEKVTF